MVCTKESNVSNISCVLIHAQTLVGHFKKSAVAMTILKEKQEQLSVNSSTPSYEGPDYGAVTS